MFGETQAQTEDKAPLGSAPRASNLLLASGGAVLPLVGIARSLASSPIA